MVQRCVVVGVLVIALIGLAAWFVSRHESLVPLEEHVSATPAPPRAILSVQTPQRPSPSPTRGFDFGKALTTAILGDGPMTLAGYSWVQKELGVSDEQKARIAVLQREYEERLQQFKSSPIASASAILKTPPSQWSEEDRRRVKAYADEFNRLCVQTLEELGKILDAKQVNRLFGLIYQRQPLSFLFSSTENRASKEIDVTAEQVARINTIVEKYKPVLEENHRRIDELIAVERKRAAETRNRTDAEILAVLTKKQRSRFAELKGKEFDFQRAILSDRQGSK